MKKVSIWCFVEKNVLKTRNNQGYYHTREEYGRTKRTDITGGKGRSKGIETGLRRSRSIFREFIQCTLLNTKNPCENDYGLGSFTDLHPSLSFSPHPWVEDPKLTRHYDTRLLCWVVGERPWWRPRRSDERGVEGSGGKSAKNGSVRRSHQDNSTFNLGQKGNDF